MAGPGRPRKVQEEVVEQEAPQEEVSEETTSEEPTSENPEIKERGADVEITVKRGKKTGTIAGSEEWIGYKKKLYALDQGKFVECDKCGKDIVAPNEANPLKEECKVVHRTCG